MPLAALISCVCKKCTDEAVSWRIHILGLFFPVVNVGIRKPLGRFEPFVLLWNAASVVWPVLSLSASHTLCHFRVSPHGTGPP